ncbi:MAG: glycosyltransferase family 2 protein [Syntrophomonadaceae bacterium]
MTPRELLRRLLRRPAGDWAGPDGAGKAARAALPLERDDAFDIVVFPDEFPPDDPLLRPLTEARHRVFRAPFSIVGGKPIENLDELRREHRLGATIVLRRGPRDAALADLPERLGWTILRVDGTEDVGELPAKMRDAFPLVSIVIVTCDNLDLNRLCLESLFARTEWPRYEVIVVDNGSTDGTAELLASLAAGHENLRVVAFRENRGFPAAVNAGLADARGDPLVVLNNDTVLTRGWLTGLRRHLLADPRLGLVGPTTNAIANEARVDAGYADVGELPRWAAEWCRAHDGETAEISMLAFFCVAIRRRTFEEVGPLDERFGLGLFEDGDYNRRVRQRGWTARCARDVFVHHWQNASFRRLGRDAYFALYEENRRKFEEKWGEPPGSPSASA